MGRLLLILAVFIIIMQARSCLVDQRLGTVSRNLQTNVIIQPIEAGAGNQISSGLDLEALGSLLNQAQDAEELERLLNQKEGINNLDLNEDNVVDFISVTEFGVADERGFSLSTEGPDGVETEIATIRVRQNSEQQADVQIHGNETVYGPNTYYHSRIGLSDVLLFAWLFSPHPPYYSPFAWGYYPAYYGRGYGTVAPAQYRTRSSQIKNRNTSSGSSTNFRKSSKPQFRPKAVSPKANASTFVGGSTNRRSSLSNPRQSQRSFRTGSNSIRRSPQLRSGSSLGGGK